MRGTAGGPRSQERPSKQGRVDAGENASQDGRAVEPKWLQGPECGRRMAAQPGATARAKKGNRRGPKGGGREVRQSKNGGRSARMPRGLAARNKAWGDEGPGGVQATQFT